jgi:hypothetical protein
MTYDHNNPKYLRTFYDIPSPKEELDLFKKENMLSLCVPSVSSSYSVCVEFMRKWFKSKFVPDFFKSEFIAGKNILSDFMRKEMIDNIRRNKPALAIRPQIDYNFDRENTDLYLYGRNIFIERSRFRDCFFVNPVNKNMVSLELEQMKVDFAFRVKLNSYNTAVDLFKFLQIACRSQATETIYADIDFHVPKALMIAIACDAKFEVKNGEVVDNCAFLRFLNKHSRLPFVYKFRGTKGECEYFMKMTKMYIHLRASEVDIDDGEREGQTDNNFIVSINVECLFPVPKFYAYYSKVNHQFAINNSDLKCTIYNLYIGPVPYINEKGWNQYMTTDYIEDLDIYRKHEKSKICFKELIKSSMENSLFKISEFTKDMFISPSAFIDIKLFNNNHEEPIDIDWNTYTITTQNVLKEQISELVFYVDLEYINNYAINQQRGYSRRIEQSASNTYVGG